jgi:20S proteasome alpha/beta subunit
MDNIFAIKGKDFIVLAADTTNMYSIMKMKVLSILFRIIKTKFGN